ncbi:hypothetical protein PA10_00130 [Pseudomonas phage pPa_SNUABM_DT01]|nr:hypothetical protein PA10_00130 [Pseudomonas phage pPa_SNUABM_DT01]
MSQKKELIYGADGKPMYELVDTTRASQCMKWVPVYGGKPLLRVGFLSPVPKRHLTDGEYIHDSRPIAWPVYHPYWIVRMSDDANMLMAYVEKLEDVKVYWPEATEITVFEEGAERYGFNANFPEPTWLKEVWAPEFTVAPRKIGVYRIFDADNDVLNIIGYSDDVDYAVQLNNHKLEYGNHEDQEFQAEYPGWQYLTIEFYPTPTLEAAKAKYDELYKFHHQAGNEEGNLPTNLLI